MSYLHLQYNRDGYLVHRDKTVRVPRERLRMIEKRKFQLFRFHDNFLVLPMSAFRQAKEFNNSLSGINFGYVMAASYGTYGTCAIKLANAFNREYPHRFHLASLFSHKTRSPATLDKVRGPDLLQDLQPSLWCPKGPQAADL